MKQGKNRLREMWKFRKNRPALLRDTGEISPGIPFPAGGRSAGKIEFGLHRSLSCRLSGLTALAFHESDLIRAQFRLLHNPVRAAVRATTSARFGMKPDTIKISPGQNNENISGRSRRKRMAFALRPPIFRQSRMLPLNQFIHATPGNSRRHQPRRKRLKKSAGRSHRIFPFLPFSH